LLGWLAVVEAAADLILPDDLVEKVIRSFNTPAWYVFGGLLAIVIGLAGSGFGWW
jgi:hypothetical protein